MKLPTLDSTDEIVNFLGLKDKPFKFTYAALYGDVGAYQIQIDDGLVYRSYTVNYYPNNKYVYTNNNLGPTVLIFRLSTKKLFSISYMTNHSLHRANKPAYYEFHNDMISKEIYYANGKIHNTTGPAFRKAYYSFYTNEENNEIIYKLTWSNSFFINNKLITRDEFFERRNHFVQ